MRGRSAGWGSVFATLIAHGHRQGDLPHYTLRQIELYYREAMALDSHGRADRIEDVNIAFVSKKISEIVKKLRKR